MSDDRDARARRHGFTTHRAYIRAQVAAATQRTPTICLYCGERFEWPDPQTYHCPRCDYTRALTMKTEA